MKTSGIITIAAAVAFASCTKITVLEPCPQLSDAEMKETIFGEWELTAIGHKTESTGNEALHVMHEDTLKSAIDCIRYTDSGAGYEISFIFSEEVEIEHTTADGDDRKCTTYSADHYTMFSPSTSSFLLNFKYNDEGKEVFKTATYRNGDGEMTEHYFNYRIGYYGRDIISKFEIDWFIIESDHILYEFTRH